MEHRDRGQRQAKRDDEAKSLPAAIWGRLYTVTGVKGPEIYFAGSGPIILVI